MSNRKPYQAMKRRELVAATKQFDAEFVVEKSRPLTADETKRWQKTKRKRGRPKTGQGYTRVSVSIEGGLLKRITALAKKRRVSRSKLFADALTEAVAQEA